MSRTQGECSLLWVCLFRGESQVNTGWLWSEWCASAWMLVSYKQKQSQCHFRWGASVHHLLQMQLEWVALLQVKHSTRGWKILIVVTWVSHVCLVGSVKLIYVSINQWGRNWPCHILVWQTPYLQQKTEMYEGQSKEIELVWGNK